MDYPKFEELNPANCREVSMRIHYPEFYDYLKERYKGKQLTFAEMIYLFYHNMDNPPVCRICGGKTKFIGYTKGYREFCSYKCMNSCKDIQERKKQTSLKNYGTTNPMQSEEVRKRLADTNIQRYGVENAFQSKELMKRAKQTCLEKYGTEYANQSEEVKKKIAEAKRQNILNKYPNIVLIESTGDGVDIYTMECHDINCDKCTNGGFKISSNTLYDRMRRGVELCTTKYPPGTHIKNTSIEKFVHDLLDEHNIKYETNNRKILSGKEIDIYIPSKRIAIECNGVYWHSMYDSSYHYEKWKKCQELNIQLLTIWEDWITTKPEIVKSIILSKLGIYKYSVGASKCKVKKVDSNEAKKFLNENHIQGFCSSTYKYGLYYQDELLSLMTFGRSRKSIMGDSKDGWELLRFCNKLNTHVVGGAERLLTHFCQDHPTGDIISFASHDISNGNLYEKLNFDKVNETHSSYWYVHNQTHQRFHRSSFMKKDLVRKGYDPSLTEEQIMMQTDYLRIYDSGQSKYILKRTSK
jgi:hypothetical protein